MKDYKTFRILEFQRNEGKEAAYRLLGAGGGTINVSDTTSGAIGLTLTTIPPVDAWWDITGHISILQSTDAAVYQTAAAFIRVTPNPVWGNNDGGSQDSYHASGRAWHRQHFRKIFPLAANTTYQVWPVLTLPTLTAGANWQYYCAPDHLWIQAKLIERPTS
jgi:hypothetical protein